MRCFVEKSRFLGTPPFKNQFLIGVSLKTAYQCVVTLFIIIINNKKGIVYIKNIIYICFINEIGYLI